MESPLSPPRMHRGHEPLRLTEARSGARVCDPQHGRFMERESVAWWGFVGKPFVGHTRIGLKALVWAFTFASLAAFA